MACVKINNENSTWKFWREFLKFLIVYIKFKRKLLRKRMKDFDLRGVESEICGHAKRYAISS